MTIVIDPGTSATTDTGGKTFLELAQLVRQECRISGSGPTDVVNQVAEYTRVLTWTSRAWMDIQRANRFWRFMRASCSCETVNGQGAYSPSTDFALTDFGHWALNYDNGDTFRNYDTAAGVTSEVPMRPVEYDEWRDTYFFGATRTTYSRPMVCAVAPDNSLVVGPIASAGYTLVGDYYRQATPLVNGDDVPDMPSQFHDLIVFKAMQYYGVSESAPEIYDLGAGMYREMFMQLVKDQAPRLRTAGGLI
jgi:hypothetical protein